MYISINIAITLNTRCKLVLYIVHKDEGYYQVTIAQGGSILPAIAVMHVCILYVVDVVESIICSILCIFW